MNAFARALHWLHCALNFHGYIADRVESFRWHRMHCMRCGEVVAVRDAFTGRRYTSPAKLAEDCPHKFLNVDDAAWLFARLPGSL